MRSAAMANQRLPHPVATSSCAAASLSASTGPKSPVSTAAARLSNYISGYLCMRKALCPLAARMLTGVSTSALEIVQMVNVET